MSAQAQVQVIDLQAYRLSKEVVHMNIISYLRHPTSTTAFSMMASASAFMEAYGLKSINFPGFRVTNDRGCIYFSALRRRSAVYDT